MGGPYGPSGLDMPLPLDHNPFSNTPFPFLDTFELLDLSRLTNDPIQHHPTWLAIPVKILVYIPKFDRKIGEDMTTHITMYYLWFVASLLLDDSIRLQLFPCTLTNNASK